MKKTRFILCIILAFILSQNAVMTASAYYSVGLNNFEKTLQYRADLFSDVLPSQWYYENISSVYEYGLMNGKGNNKFDPAGNITIAEAITVASRIHCIYNYDEPFYTDSSEEATIWYEPYTAYAKDMGIITGDNLSYGASATRAEFAEILAASIDSLDLEPVNIVDEGAIPDVPMDSDYADAVYLLYRAGVLTGLDSVGTFKPDTTISRAEAAAIITRIVDPDLRKNIELTGEY